jgi:hypothetical protein
MKRAKKSAAHAKRAKVTSSSGRAGRTLLSHAALDALLSETISFVIAAGLPRKRLTSHLRKEAHRLGAAGLQPRTTGRGIKEGHEILHEVAGVVHDWHRQPAYTSRTSGEPRALGFAELRELTGKRFPRDRVATAIEWMEMNGIVRRRKDGKFAMPMGRPVLVRSQHLAMERAAALVPQYLRISLRNAGTSNVKSRDIDRDARVFFLPEKWLGLWRAVARERTEAFLEGIDNWLEDHTRPDDAGPVREVAIHCYGYTGQPRSSRASRTNIGRLEAEAR